MKILLIGGSQFVGPYLVKLLLNHGYNLTIFNRGLLRSEYPTGTRFVKGDRNGGFNLKERFDAVIDMCAYSGAQTENALRQLRFDFFLHFSTAAVYKKTIPLRGISRREKIFPFTEESPLGDWQLWGDYNKGKVECEKILEKSGVKYASLRPVYILGPKNYCDREHFIYSRIRNNRPLVLPGDGKAIVQFVFAEEVAESIALIIEKHAVGTFKGAFNCAGDETITLIDLVKMMGKVVGREPILRFNPSADGENFNETEFPFANENVVISNNKIKELGVKFTPLLRGLKKDYESYYKNII
ncbi:MAG: NAD-dependent epimerase/dehydratase family protein [bacterium]|nr:NAD-dependent epimerase/dehydratase family protein [bacterium]